MAEAVGRAGQIADGLAMIDEAIVRSERGEERWATAELLRIKGELLLLQGAPGAAAAAEDHFRQALDWARRQGALSWELRTATSLARLSRQAGIRRVTGASSVNLRQAVESGFLHRRRRANSGGAVVVMNSNPSAALSGLVFRRPLHLKHFDVTDSHGQLLRKSSLPGSTGNRTLPWSAIDGGCTGRPAPHRPNAGEIERDEFAGERPLGRIDTTLRTFGLRRQSSGLGAPAA